MPLRNLWNSLRRQSVKTAEDAVRDSRVEHDIVKLEGAQSPSLVQQKLNRKAAKPRVSELCATLQKLAPETILEIGVGNGKQSEEFLTGLKDAGLSIRYFAIDQFELADGPLSLREFHQMLRNAGIRPQIFPEPVVSGLTRFLHTIGSADVVLLTEPIPSDEEKQIRSLLQRISNNRTRILSLNNGKWTPLSGGLHSDRRAA